MTRFHPPISQIANITKKQKSHLLSSDAGDIPILLLDHREIHQIYKQKRITMADLTIKS